MDTDKEIEFQSLLDDLENLIVERDSALSSLDQVDSHLAALSTAIGLTSSALNTPAGLLCTLRLISRPADVLGHSQSQSASYLFELTLYNESPLSLIGNWNILVARLRPQELSTLHVASLPRIAAGAAWTSTMALDLSSSINDAVDLAVFLCFNGVTENNGNPPPVYSSRSSNIALLHVFRIDALHSLQASSGGAGTGSSITSTSSYSTSSQAMEIKLGVPKQFFGLDPEPQTVLDVLLKQGEKSLRPPLTKQISNLEKKERSGGGGVVQRKQQKAVIQGQLPPQMSYPSSITSKAKSSPSATSTATAAPAGVNVQPAPFSLAASSSPHAAVDLSIEAGDVVDCLQLHKAVLARVQQLQTAVLEMAGSSGDDGGIKLSHGVVVPPACSFSAIIDSNELDEISGKLSSLKEAAVRLQETVGAAEADSVDDKERFAIELLDLVKSTRNQTRNLVITL
jgi:hypothetical protein